MIGSSGWCLHSEEWRWSDAQARCAVVVTRFDTARTGRSDWSYRLVLFSDSVLLRAFDGKDSIGCRVALTRLCGASFGISSVHRKDDDGSVVMHIYHRERLDDGGAFSKARHLLSELSAVAVSELE